MGRLLLKHLIRPVLTVMLLALALLPVQALNRDTPIQNYLIDHWTVSDGLASNLIHSIAQTPDGYLWLATNKGLVRFDGIVFKPIPFVPHLENQSHRIAVPEALYFDKNHTLWIGSSAGLTAYDIDSRQFKTYTSDDGLSRGKIRRISKDIAGNLWIGFVSSYVNRFDKQRFHVLNNSHGLGGNVINAIIEDQKGTLMVGTRNNGVFIHSENRFTPYPIPGLDGFLINLLQDQKGTLWLSTNKGLLQKKSSTVTKYTTAQGLSSSHISDILEDSNQNLWIGTIEGLNRLIPQPGHRPNRQPGHRPNRQPGHRAQFEHILKPFIIISLFEDREGSLWAGTYKSGLFRLKDSRFTTVEPPRAPAGTILSAMLQRQDKEILMGTADGILLRLRQNQALEPITIPGLSGTGILAIHEDRHQSLWLGTNGQGVIHLQDTRMTRITTRQGLAKDLVTTIFQDREDRLWVGTFDGVSLIPVDGGPIQSLTSRGGLSGKKVHTISQDRTGNIWIAADRGITVLKDGTIPPAIHADKSSGPPPLGHSGAPPSGQESPLTHYLPGTVVTWIYEEPATADSDPHIFWLATLGAGLKRFSLNDQTVTSYTTVSGMSTDFIYRFFPDSRGNFWFMSDSGILRVSKTTLNRFAQGLIPRIDCVSFGLSEGLSNPEFNNPFPGHSAFQTPEGELWFMNKQEISVINPETISINKVPPPIVIESVLIDGQPLLQRSPDTVLQLKDIRDLRFRFTAPTLLSSPKVTFQYKLDGLSDQWTFLAPGSKREAHFQNLEPGAYRFKILAANAEGIWNTTGPSFSFELQRSFTKTAFFKKSVLFLIGLLGIVIAFLLYNVYQGKKTVETVKYKSSPLHPDFVQQCVKKLKHLMEVEFLYRDEDISLPSLAQKMNISHHQLSQLLNDRIKRKFFDYINVYRIEEAKKIMIDPKGKNMKIQSIAYDIGFKTMTAFYKAFKKHTGMTPSQYKQRPRK